MRRQQQNQNPDLRARFASGKKNQRERNGKSRGRAFWLGWRRCARLFSAFAGNGRECRSVELRALCNEVPRTPPGPEGSNGTGITSGAADHPKFLSSETFKLSVLSFWSQVKNREIEEGNMVFFGFARDKKLAARIQKPKPSKKSVDSCFH